MPVTVTAKSEDTGKKELAKVVQSFEDEKILLYHPTGSTKLGPHS